MCFLPVTILFSVLIIESIFISGFLIITNYFLHPTMKFKREIHYQNNGFHSIRFITKRGV